MNKDLYTLVEGIDRRTQFLTDQASTNAKLVDKLRLRLATANALLDNLVQLAEIPAQHRDKFQDLADRTLRIYHEDYLNLPTL